VIRLILHLFIASLVVSMLAGCATSVPIAEVNLPRPGWPVEIYATQQEVAVDASVTNPMVAGGGLLGAVITSSIDKSRNQKAEDAVTGIRDLLISYPISERFAETIKGSELVARLTTGSQVNVQREFRPDFSEQPLAEPIIRLVPEVAFSNDLSQLEIRLIVAELKPDERGRPERDGFWSRYSVTRFMEEPPSGKKREDYANAWSGLGLETLQAYIEEAMDMTVEMAVAHIQTGMLPLAETRVIADEYSGSRLKVYFWRSAGEYVWAAAKEDSQRVYGFVRDEVELETDS